jgi:prepilin-type processing-associated H-X9-DG protein
LPLPSGFSFYNPATTGAAIALLLPAVQKVREAANRAKDANNLKQIALAMHMHHDRLGHLPAAAICSKDGKPLLSWRVALLPYLDQENLYKEFKLDEPWDSPHNKKLLSKMPMVYKSPVQESATDTYYRVFVGAEAAFDLHKTRRFADITDGLSNTWMVVDAGEAVPWTKPDELVYDPKGPLPKLGNHLAGGFNVAFMDGSVRYFARPPDERTQRALITHAGGEVIRLDP